MSSVFQHTIQLIFIENFSSYEEIISLIFIFALKIHFHIKMKIRDITSMALILINNIQDMILNNKQEDLAVDRTPWALLPMIL